MKFSTKTSSTRKIDDVLTIIDLFPGENFSFDCVISKLTGEHGFFTNKVSDRGYYILSGDGVVIIDNEEFKVAKGDFLAIKKGKRHGVVGNLEMLVITAPPFSVENEVHSEI